MDWFELSTGFHGDPKVVALQARLKNPLAECYVSRIYAYCYQQEQDRFGGPSAVAALERASGWVGRPGALVRALFDTKFLDRCGDVIIVHGVEKRLAKARTFRERNAERQQKWRDRNANVTPERNGYVTRYERVTDALRNGVPTDLPTDPPLTPPPPAEPWVGVLTTLRARARLKQEREVVARWLEPLTANVTDGELVLTAPNEHHRAFVADQYAGPIRGVLESLGTPLPVRVVSSDPEQAAGKAPSRPVAARGPGRPYPATPETPESPSRSITGV